MKRTEFLNAIWTISAAVPITGALSTPAGKIAGIAIPDTAAARKATVLARDAEPPEIFNHSVRTFFFAELLASHDKTAHDSEVVYIASILHDLGLTDMFMSATNRFEVDSANAAREMLKELMPEPAVATIWDAITLHDIGGIARWKQAEVRLVNAGVGVDFGAHLDVLTRSDVTAVLQAAPRANFIPVFLHAVAAVAKRKPFATGNCFVTDVGYRMVPGFHLENFCDSVKDDPFAGF